MFVKIRPGNRECGVSRFLMHKYTIFLLAVSDIIKCRGSGAVTAVVTVERRDTEY